MSSHITWKHEPELNGHVAHVELSVELSFESGYRGEARVWAELFLGYAGEREIRVWVLGESWDFLDECGSSKEELNDCVVASLPSDVFEWPLGDQDRAILDAHADTDVSVMMETEFAFDACDAQVAS